MTTVAYAQKRMLRISEVARRLDCSESTVRRLIQNGQLPATQFAGKNFSIRIDEAVLEQWLRGCFPRDAE
jgi:excisionase family DNA binding protein